MRGRGRGFGAAADGVSSNADGEGVIIFSRSDGHSAEWSRKKCFGAAWGLGIAAAFWRVFVRETCHFCLINVVFLVSTLVAEVCLYVRVAVRQAQK